jgi:hypothetical protein
MLTSNSVKKIDMIYFVYKYFHKITPILKLLVVSVGQVNNLGKTMSMGIAIPHATSPSPI